MERKFEMNAFSLVHTSNKEFWKQEKMLFFLYEWSLGLIVVSILFYHETSFWDNSLFSIVKNGECGVLQGTILLGFGLLWHHSLEQRRMDFKIQRMLGTGTSIICMALQIELFLFQILSIIGISFFFGIYSMLAELQNFKELFLGFFHIQLELQLLFGFLGVIYIKKI